MAGSVLRAAALHQPEGKYEMEMGPSILFSAGDTLAQN